MNSGSELSAYEHLRERDLRQEGILIGEGSFVVERLLASGLEVLSVLCTVSLSARYRELCGDRCPVFTLSEPGIAALAGFPFHRGVLAAARRPRLPGVTEAAFPPSSLVVICPGVGESENIGSIIRSAAAFGAAGLIVGIRTADPFSRKAIRASMGTVFRLPLYTAGTGVSEDGETGAVEILNRKGLLLAAAVSEGPALSPGELRRNAARTGAGGIALVLGNEAEGVPEPWASACRQHVRIPMAPGVDSLNVGVAAGILFYALSNPGDSW